MIRLKIHDGPETGVVYELGEGIYSVGRGPDNSVVLRDPSVSRCHALILCGADGCRIEDLGSANGTFRNDLRVAACSLGVGDRLAIGEFEFVVEPPPAPSLRRLLAGLRGRSGSRRGGRLRRPRSIPADALHAIAADSGLLLPEEYGAVLAGGKASGRFSTRGH
jgi:pSer/pThr/pTyr-binding forkhead associated (FHA) protein